MIDGKDSGFDFYLAGTGSLK